MLCHILNTIIDDFRLFIIEIKIMMNILLLRRYALNHEELLICASVFTSVSFFSSIAETGNRSVKASLQFSDSHGSAVESAYKSPFYKIWQDLIKNKPLKHNGSAIHLHNKKGSHIKQVAVSYQSWLERVKTAENYIVQSATIHPKKCLWLRDLFSFCNHNNCSTCRCNIYGFVLHVCTAKHILKYVKNILLNNGICGCKEQSSKLSNITSPIYSNAMWQNLKIPHNIGFYIDKFFHHRVYCA
ncbi:hypothetical protein AT246_02195 [Bartonella henselae]|nr:hypothetical protein AT243_04255 [Bartonella henselae]OLL51221.1 hypothetical protein AT247_04520 [Bartonella henselae]OLL51890.1 hypothetical protein AT241_04820 [Bartonella henselae]OLL57028.1 hypothetical protein AT246_02195 [Bartonella henselae]